ncbi:MAG: hypothetical protein WDN72_04915 [Alphaproteobacteria bacterium]
MATDAKKAAEEAATRAKNAAGDAATHVENTAGDAEEGIGGFFKKLWSSRAGVVGGILGIAAGWLTGTMFGGPLSWIVMLLAIPGMAYGGSQLASSSNWFRSLLGDSPAPGTPAQTPAPGQVAGPGQPPSTQRGMDGPRGYPYDSPSPYDYGDFPPPRGPAFGGSGIFVSIGGLDFGGGGHHHGGGRHGGGHHGHR